MWGTTALVKEIGPITLTSIMAWSTTRFGVSSIRLRWDQPLLFSKMSILWKWFISAWVWFLWLSWSVTSNGRTKTSTESDFARAKAIHPSFTLLSWSTICWKFNSAFRCQNEIIFFTYCTKEVLPQNMKCYLIKIKW